MYGCGRQVVRRTWCWRHYGSFEHSLSDKIHNQGVRSLSLSTIQYHRRKNGQVPFEIRSRKLVYKAAAKASMVDQMLETLQGEDRLFGPWTISKDEIFAESAMSFAFVNLKPVVSGHVLLAPKRVCKRYTQLSMEEVADLWQLAKVRHSIRSHVSYTFSESNRYFKQVVGKELELHAQTLFPDRKRGKAGRFRTQRVEGGMQLPITYYKMID